MDKSLVTSIVDFSVPRKIKHGFGFKKEVSSKSFASTGGKVLDLNCFMDNDDNLNNVYHVEVEVKEEVNVLHLDSKIKKDNMYEET